MRRFARVAAVCATVMAAGLSAAWGKECNVHVLPVPLVPSNNGQIVMQWKVQDQPAQFVLDTGAFWSVVKRGKIGDARIRTAPVQIQGVGDRVSDQMVTLHSLSVAKFTLSSADMFVVPDGVNQNDDIWGLMGADIAQKFDIEIDMLNNKLNFYLPTDCGYDILRAKESVVSELPFIKNDVKQIFVYMILDGKKIKVLVDTGASSSFLDLAKAESLFSLRAGEPALEESGDSADIHGDVIKTYRHKFDKLEMDGIIFHNPLITIGKSSVERSSDYGNIYDMLLGIHQLRGLHIFISYSQRTMYVAVASPDKAAQNATSTPAPAPLSDSLDRQLMQPYIERANAATRDGHPDQAAAAMDDLVKHYPTDAQVYYYRALSSRNRRDYDAAIADLDHAILLFPSYADAYRLRGELRRGKHDDDGAKADYDMAIKFEPSSAAAYRARAEQRRQAGDYEGALADANHAIELDPKLISAYLTRGAVFVYQHDYDRAVADYERAIDLNPKNALVLDILGQVLHKAGRQDEALAQYVHAEELAPKDGHIFNGHCWQLAMMGQFQGALDVCNRSIELSPKWYPVIDSRGYVYLKLHRLADAIADFDSAIEINPKSAHSMYGRSLAKQEAGDAKGAAADLAAAVQLQPDIAQHFPE